MNLATGNFTAHTDDLVLPGRVLSAAFIRWYNSADGTTGPLGPGWTHSYNWRLTDNTTSVEVRRGDGRRDTFTRNQDGTYAEPPDLFDVLVKNADGTFTLTLTTQLQYEFSSAGRLTRIHEPAGNQITFAYTVDNLTGITDTVARQIVLSYDGSNRLTQLQDPLGRKVTYTYDASGRLATVTDKIGNAPGQNPAQHRWTYGYDGTTRHLTTITDPDGRVRVTNTYDGQGRVYQQRDGLNALTQISYGTGQATLTDPRGHATVYTFDARARVLSQTDQVGANTYTISFLYNAVGNRTSVTDRNGKTTEFTYDTHGNLLTKTDPQVDPQTPRYLTRFAYDSRNNLTQVTDPRSFVTTMSYDPVTNALISASRQIDAATYAVTKYEYGDPANPGLPTKAIAPRGNTTPTPNYAFATTLTYDTQANLAQRVDPDGAKTTFTYDGAGRLTSFVDPDGYSAGAVPAEHTWTIAYDENDRETSRTDPLTNRISYGYDGAGDRTSLTDRRGDVTTYTYDANTRLATVQQKPDPVGQPSLTYTTVVTRDGDGNATRITQANGVVTDYGFDVINRLATVTTHPDAQTNLVTSYMLDGNGQPLSRTTGDNVTVTYAYDALARLTSVAAPGLTTITYAYDATSRRTQMVDGTGTTTYQYDGLGRVTQVAAPNGTLVYAYDLDGNRTMLGYPGSQNVTYAYSPSGRLNAVTDWASRVSTYTYRDSGLVATLQYPNSMRATYSYDRAQRLTQLTNAVGATTITQHTYMLDPEGNRTALDEYVQGITPLVLSWSASVQVNDVQTGQQDHPALAVGTNNAGYLLWDDARSGNADIYFSLRDPTTNVWGTNLKINGDNGTRLQLNPAIAVDAAGNAYAVWQDDRNGASNRIDTDVYFAKRAASGSWGANVRVNDDSGGNPVQRNPKIAVSGNGAATSVWIDFRQNQQNIYSSQLSPDGSAWAANKRVSDNTSSAKASPDVTVGPDGSAYAVWEDSRNGNPDIYFSKYLAGTAGWTANTKVSDDPGVFAQRNPHIGLDAAGNLVVVWLDERSTPSTVRMSALLAGASSWTKSQGLSIPPAVPLSLGLSVRADGRAFAVWHDGQSASTDIYGAEFDVLNSPGGLGTGILLSDDLGSTNQQNPTVAYTAGELLTAWRDDRVGGGDIRARHGAISNGLDHFTYTYDGLNRLTSVAGPVPEAFSFDAGSNIVAGGYAYDQANRLLSDGSQSYTWTGSDRLAQRGTDSFTFDALGRLTHVSASTALLDYVYDGDGLLSQRIDLPPPEVPPTPGHVGPFLWDTSRTDSLLVAAGTDKVVLGLAPLYATHSDNSTLSFVRDGLGSTRAESADAGAVSSAFRFRAYGGLFQSTGNAPSLLGFAGEMVDGTGLIYLRARWYDPNVGRFISKDALGGSPEGPSGLNGFTYGAGNPTGRTDPSGYCTPPPGGVGFCIQRFIPTRTACAGWACGAGDDRYAPTDNGGMFRISQWVDASGNVTAQVSSSLASVGPFSDPRGPQPGSMSRGCTGTTDPSDISLECTAYNGYTDATKSPGGIWIPGAPPGPIQTKVQITFAPNGRPIVFAQGTYYPSLEVWYYGGGGNQLAYFYNAVGVGQDGLARTGNLARSFGGTLPK